MHYDIIKFPHPDAKQSPSKVKTVGSLKEAQRICKRKDSSYKEGPTSDWYFLGYEESSSPSKHVTLW